MDWGKGNKADIPVSICYRDSWQVQLLVLVLAEDFNLLNICWKCGMAQWKQFRRIVNCVKNTS